MGKGCQFGSRAWLGWFEEKPDIVAGFVLGGNGWLELGVGWLPCRERKRGGDEKGRCVRLRFDFGMCRMVWTFVSEGMLKERAIEKGRQVLPLISR